MPKQTHDNDTAYTKDKGGGKKCRQQGVVMRACRSFYSYVKKIAAVCVVGGMGCRQRGYVLRYTAVGIL